MIPRHYLTVFFSVFPSGSLLTGECECEYLVTGLTEKHFCRIQSHGLRERGNNKMKKSERKRKMKLE